MDDVQEVGSGFKKADESVLARRQCVLAHSLFSDGADSLLLDLGFVRCPDVH